MRASLLVAIASSAVAGAGRLASWIGGAGSTDACQRAARSDNSMPGCCGRAWVFTPVNEPGFADTDALGAAANVGSARVGDVIAVVSASLPPAAAIASTGDVPVTLGLETVFGIATRT